MSPESEYYRTMRVLANEQRSLFSLRTAKIGRAEFRNIFKHYGIKIHLWPMPGLSGKPLNHLRGAYLNVEGTLHVMIDRHLPNDPYIFTLAHELKHHLSDSSFAESFCHDENQKDVIEIGAEVFAAELLMPQREFISTLDEMDVEKGNCSQNDLVKLKHESGTSLSYTGLRKRAILLGYAQESMPSSGWQKIEESIYGIPFYKTLRSRQLHSSS